MAEEGSKSNSEIASASPSEVDAVIRIQEVRKNYKMGDEIIRALDGVNCQINRNEYVAITVSYTHLTLPTIYSV